MKPLQDVRILAVEQYGSGPFGSVHLADLGAELIKIEDPSSDGDIARYVLPEQHGEDSLFFETFNRDKRSLNLDISLPAGRAVFEDLVELALAGLQLMLDHVHPAPGVGREDLTTLGPYHRCLAQGRPAPAAFDRDVLADLVGIRHLSQVLARGAGLLARLAPGGLLLGPARGLRLGVSV